MRLYRISDELWFWSHAPENVTLAWETLHTYGAMVGLKVNAARSGSASVLGQQKSGLQIIPGPAPLPQKTIHWGYLQLTASGVFSIDQKAVDKFLQEMKGLLDRWVVIKFAEIFAILPIFLMKSYLFVHRSECVLEWINIFNKYFTFFLRNFGKSAVASGKQHLDQIVGALNVIYSGLLGPHPDPVTLLRARFPSQLGAGELVDAWIYWPLERGGLGLVNPFIAVMALRQSFAEAEKGSPLDLDFSKLPQQDRQTWEDLKKEWERNYGPSGQGQNQGPFPVRPSPPHPTKLPTWEEYVASRETELWAWYSRYVHLLERPGPSYPPVGDGFHSLEWRGGEETQRNYFMWLYSYYEPQLKGHFGSVTFINAKLLPMSMIGNIQKAKVVHN